MDAPCFRQTSAVEELIAPDPFSHDSSAYAAAGHSVADVTGLSERPTKNSLMPLHYPLQ